MSYYSHNQPDQTNPSTNEITLLKSTISQIAHSENKLREQVIKKDKLIIEQDKQLKENESLISKHKRLLTDKDSVIDNLKLETQDLSMKLKNMTEKYNGKAFEIGNIINSQAEKSEYEYNERRLLKSKIDELSHINLSLLEKTKEYNFNIESIDRENKSLKAINNELSSQISCYLKEIDDKFTLKKAFLSLEDKNALLQSQNEQMSSRISFLEKEKSDLTMQINNELKQIIDWTETYLSSYFIKGYEIPSLPISLDSNLVSELKISDLKKCLDEARKKIHFEVLSLDAKFNEEKGVNDSLSIQKQKLVNENMSLKQGNLDLSQEIYTIKEKVSPMKEDEKEFLYQLEKRLTMILGYMNLEYSSNDYIEPKEKPVLHSQFSQFSQYNEIHKQRLKCIDILHVISTYSKESYEKSKSEYNSMSDQVTKLKSIIKDQEKKLEVRKDDKISCEVVLRLEKRVSHLERDVELKQIQIKSQEQMLNRRDQEILDLKKGSSNGLGLGYDQGGYMRKINMLENEKEKLISDNINLINLVNNLKTDKNEK